MAILRARENFQVQKRKKREKLGQRENGDGAYTYFHGMCKRRKSGDLLVERVCRMVSQHSDFRGRLRKTNPVIFQTVFPSGLQGASCKAFRESTVSIFRCAETERGGG